jgi:LuxR family quorum-sensing system transcriptional regulator CciR
MTSRGNRRNHSYGLALTSVVVDAIRAVTSPAELLALLGDTAREMTFRHFALIDHDGLRRPGPDRVDLKNYPAAITERLVGQHRYRRDPVIRGSIFAGGAFLWSDLQGIIRMDRHDRDSFALGASEGLNEGITVPYVLLGRPMGSCTFAGTRRPELVPRFLGAAQMIGIFAFQSALRMLDVARPLPSTAIKLHPRPRDCVVLAGQGHSNKEIARALALTPRTVDGYLTEARRLFEAHDRTELVVSAVLAGEVGIHELARPAARFP